MGATTSLRTTAESPLRCATLVQHLLRNQSAHTSLEGGGLQKAQAAWRLRLPVMSTVIMLV